MELSKLNWDFESSKSRSNIHALFKYPATMVPDMQKEILENEKNRFNIENVLDPFMGSGTVLMESSLLGLNSIGIDANPLAYLGVFAKTLEFSEEDLKNLKLKFIKNLKKTRRYKIWDFPKIDKWFRSDITKSISRIRTTIFKSDNQKEKQFLLLPFIDLVNKYSNSRSTTFKLHIKETKQIEKMANNVIHDYLMSLDIAINNYNEFSKELNLNVQHKLIFGDSKSVLNDESKIGDSSVDFILTSPPYGDNHTTVTYGQFSFLALNWIGSEFLKNIKCTPEIDTITGIDSSSLGGKLSTISKESVIYSPTLNGLVSKIESDRPDKVKKIISFYDDFFECVKGMNRVLKMNSRAVLIVGDRNVNGEVIHFDKILIELAEYIGFSHVESYPRKISRGNIAQSIKNETIVILEKIGHFISDTDNKVE